MTFVVLTEILVTRVIKPRYSVTYEAVVLYFPDPNLLFHILLLGCAIF